MRTSLAASIAGPVPPFASRRAALGGPGQRAARRSDWYALVARLLLEPPSRARLFELARWMASAEHARECERPEASLALRTAIDAALASAAGWRDLQAQFARLPHGEPGLEASLQERTECGYREAVGGPCVAYVGNELRMMSVLCFGEMGAWGDAKGAEARELADRERRLLDEQVLRCLPRLGDALAELARDGFYAALARYAALACTEDRRHLERVLSAGPARAGVVAVV